MAIAGFTASGLFDPPSFRTHSLKPLSINRSCVGKQTEASVRKEHRHILLLIVKRSLYQSAMIHRCRPFRIQASIQEQAKHVSITTTDGSHGG
jgi:hypothetical protein